MAIRWARSITSVSVDALISPSYPASGFAVCTAPMNTPARIYSYDHDKKVQAILKAADLSTITPAEISRQLHISDTTLRRKLRQEGANFAKLLTEERKWRCAQALAANPTSALRICQTSAASRCPA